MCVKQFSRRGKNLLSLEQSKHKSMKLGAFSISLSVKDLEASRAFYEKLGGVRKEKTLYNNPDGGQSPIWRYVWADVRTIL